MVTMVRISEKKSNEKITNSNRFWQIDFLKAFSMALVILDHSTTHAQNFVLASPLWQRIAIPVFMVVLGFNWAKSLNNKGHLPYRVLFSWRNYWRNKIVRFLLPYAILYGISTILFFSFNRQVPGLIWSDPWFRYIGFTLVYGPGLWFIPTLFVTILVFPAIYIIFDFFRRIPMLSKVSFLGSLIGLGTCFGIEVGLTYFIGFILPITGIPATYAFLFTPFNLMVGIGLGIWLSQNHKWYTLRNAIIWILGIISLGFIIVYTFNPTPDPFLNPNLFKIIDFAKRLLDWSIPDYCFLFTPYSAMLVLIFLNILPKGPKGGFARFISMLSRSTYHIFIVQILYFSIWYTYFIPMATVWGYLGPEYLWINYAWYPANLIITFTLGTFWYRLENQLLWKKVKQQDIKRTQELTINQK
jgi:hypothetical protein